MSDIVAKIRAEKNSNIDTLILEASNVEISNNIGLIIPVGTTSERESVVPRKGAIRFNSSDTAFEGYDGNNWGTLGGVKDVSQTTLIRAETSPGANNKELDFITDNTQRMQIDASGDLKFGDISNTSPDIKFSIDYDSGNISAQNILPKLDDTYSLGDSNNKWKQLHLDSSGINIANIASITKDANNSIVLNNTIGNFKITGNLDISGNLTIPGSNIQAGGQLISSSHIIGTPIGTDGEGQINREEALFTTLDVEQESVFRNDITINTKIKFASEPGSDTTNKINGEFASIDVSSDSIFKSNLTICGELIVNNDVTLNANVDISNHLNVLGDVSLNSNVDISNHLNVLGDVSLNSNVDISNHLNVNGDLNLNSGLAINSNYGISGERLISQGPNIPPIWSKPVYGSFYLQNDITVPNASNSTYYRVGSDTGFTQKTASHSGMLANSSGGHLINVPVSGVYKIEGTIVASTEDSQGAYHWDARIQHVSSNNTTTIAISIQSFTDYHLDGTIDTALVWRNTIHLQTMLDLNAGDTLYMELNQSSGSKVKYIGDTDGRGCRINLFKVN